MASYDSNVAPAPEAWQSLGDEELVELLFTAADGLPRIVVDEILCRRERLTYPLVAVLIDPRNWDAPLPAWWAPVHATFLLGAIDDPAGDSALFSALRDADALDNDWISMEMPSILGRRGSRVRSILEGITNERDASATLRAAALHALAATTLAAPDGRDNIFATVARIFNDRREDPALRADAGNILLDFQIAAQRDALLSFARHAEQHRRAPWDVVAFGVDDVERAFAEPNDLHWYRRDWLAFYDPQQIAARQERWAREDAEREAAAPSHKVGRNDLCPCGSDKKYKKCCLA